MTREELLKIAKPILFNTDMVKAILDGRKTVTRRIVKPPYYVQGDEKDKRTLITQRVAPKGSKLYREIGRMPYPDSPYRIGDILYVRESVFQGVGRYLDVSGESVSFPTNDFEYYADGTHTRGRWKDKEQLIWMNRRPSIHMLKEAARIFLKVTDIRVKRICDILEIDFLKEGLEAYKSDGRTEKKEIELEYEFEDLWNSTVKKSEIDKYGWDANPWVWVIEFEKLEVEQ